LSREAYAALALLEETKSLPWGAVWDAFCRRQDAPAGAAWLPEAVAHGETAARTRGRARHSPAP
jgi:L-rhamnose isomerase